METQFRKNVSAVTLRKLPIAKSAPNHKEDTIIQLASRYNTITASRSKHMFEKLKLKLLFEMSNISITSHFGLINEFAKRPNVHLLAPR